MTTYSWSKDEEHYQGNLDTVEDAVAEGVAEGDLAPGDIITIGENIPHTAADLVRSCITADRVIEMLSEYAYDNVGEFAEDWPDISKEDAVKLDEALVAAVAPFIGEPTFWSIGKTVEVEVTLEMFVKAHPLDETPHCKRCYEPMSSNPQKCMLDDLACEAITWEQMLPSPVMETADGK